MATSAIQRRQNELRKLRELAEDSIFAVFYNKQIAGYLDVQARLPAYSQQNIMLLFLQRPNASLLYGFQAWHKLGRHVLGDESGIKIIAPDSANGDWKILSLFDISQTNGEAITSEAFTVNSEQLHNIISGKISDKIVTIAVEYVMHRHFFLSGDVSDLGTIYDWSRERDTAELKEFLETVNVTVREIIAELPKQKGAAPVVNAKPPPQIERTPELDAKPQTAPEPVTERIPETPQKPQSPLPLDDYPDLDVAESERHYIGKSGDLIPVLAQKAMQLFRDVLNVYLITDSGEEIIVENSDDIISHDGIFGVEFSQWYESEEYQAKKNQEVAILQGLTEPQAEKSPVPKKPIPPKTPVQPVKPKKPKAPKPPDKPIDTTTPAKTQSQKQRKSKIYKSGYNSVTQTAKPSLLGRIAQQKQKLKQKEAQKAAKAVSK